MNRQESARIVAAIIAACPSQSSKLDERRATSMVDTFAALLGDLSYGQVNAAVTVLLQTSTWMPSVADIRSTVLDLQRGPSAPGGEAWGSVLRAVQCEGSYKTPGVDFQFRDPVTARCVAAFGWQALCLSENQVSDRARFIELYDQLANQDRRELQSPALAEARRSREIAAADTKQIGDVGKLIALVADSAKGEP